MAEVWEVWDKESKSVLFLTINGGGVLLSNEEDPYNLKIFFQLHHLLALIQILLI